MFTSCPESVLSCETSDGISDHDHILITRAKLRAHQNKKSPRTIPLYKKADWESIKQSIKTASEDFFSDFPSKKSVNENWNFFKKSLWDAIDK